MKNNTEHQGSGSLSWHSSLPFLFVILYGSGFIGAKLGLPHADPMSFLSLRFLLAGLVLFMLARLLKIPTPPPAALLHIAVAGSLTVGLFSIGVFVSLDQGLSPALSAMIIALQPILVGILAGYMVGEKLQPLQWLGLALGLAGVATVIGHKIDLDSASLGAVAMSALGLLGLTLGNVYQKRYCADMNLLIGGATQSLTSGFICLVLLPLGPESKLNWNGEFTAALLYMTFGVSIGALSLLYLMIRSGDVSRVASVFYLMPVSAALAGFILFDTPLDPSLVFGILIIGLGVYLHQRPPKPAPSSTQDV